ncbi:MAG TPA: aminotransferase class III-fold pyridoxal phosphate-dependent enzyme [Terriglobales bacterium]|nr:aminotransferase class III-fold pyridoxal phosphate-dependent enzyme [Terriglobales bacterium]
MPPPTPSPRGAVLAFKAVGGVPCFIESAKGSKIRDADENNYLDYVCPWGALILGSAHSKVVKALREQAGKGTSYGAPTKLETHLAELVIDAFPEGYCRDYSQCKENIQAIDRGLS